MRSFVRDGRVPTDHSSIKVYSPQWIDPWWWINGSKPEKIVMAALAERNIYFQYRQPTNNLGGLVDPSWEADILVPQYKIWIEVQGAYYHTLPGQLKKDAIREYVIKAAGWTPLFWWEWDILTRMNDLMDEVPQFYRVKSKSELAARKKYGTTPGLDFKMGSNIDQLLGHRTAMSNRTQPMEFITRRASSRRPKVQDR